MSYFKPTLVGFNEAPPSDDGAQTAANRVDWSKHISKIGTPLRTYIDAVNDATESAFLAANPFPSSIWNPSVYAGFSSNPVIRFHYQKYANLVTMQIEGISYGTMNGAPIIISGMPADIRPSVGRVVFIPVYIQTGGFGNLRAQALAVVRPNGDFEVWNPINITDGANTFPRFVQSNTSGRTFIIDNSEVFAYTI